MVSEEVLVQATLLPRNDKCYLAFLDACKAFDTVWHNGLFFKLFQYGLTNDIWFLLHFWYRNLRSSVKWGDKLSRSFAIRQGVRQGALLSTLIYSIYINDLLVEMESQHLGVCIGQLYCGILAYAVWLPPQHTCCNP